MALKCNEENIRLWQTDIAVPVNVFKDNLHVMKQVCKIIMFYLLDTFEQQHMAIQLVTSFYDSVMWCVRHKVLPEVNMADALSKELIPYLSHKIINSTIARLEAYLHCLLVSNYYGQWIVPDLI